jgi:hypothetical protein
MGLPRRGTIGFGISHVSGLSLEPSPPAIITAFIEKTASSMFLLIMHGKGGIYFAREARLKSRSAPI